MGALVPTKLSRFASFRAIVSLLQPRLVPPARVQFASRVRFLARKRRPHCLQRFATKCSNSMRSFSVKAAFANWR